MAGRQPDYNLSAFNKRTEAKGNIGVAWIGENGRISIKFNLMVNVSTADPDWVFTLFPNDNAGRGASPRPAPRPARTQIIEEDPDDDIPF